MARVTHPDIDGLSRQFLHPFFALQPAELGEIRGVAGLDLLVVRSA